eukprot:COSAG02_NODE_4970_length_4772_cov_2.518083_5_plen_176_part_01
MPEYELFGSHGSTWSTPEQRLDNGWPAPEPEASALVTLEPEQPSEWCATVSVAPKHAGEQAGLYAYADALSWCKLVLEAAGNGDVFLAFADQCEGVPFLRGKLPMPNDGSGFSGAVQLRLAVTDLDLGRVSGYYRWKGTEPWAPVTRGLGWLEASELAAGQERGRLSGDDPRSKQV